MDTGGRRTHVLSLAATLIACLLAATPAAAKGSAVSLSEKSAVPGQVVLLSGKGLEPKQAKVAIGGKKAEVATRSKRKLGVVVPDLKPGKSPVVAKQKGKRLKGSLRVGKGFDGTVEPVLDTARAVSAEVGPGGGVITATGADGTVFTLSIPAEAVFAPTTITLTPVARLGGLQRNEDESLPAVQFGPDGLVFAKPATLMITPIRPLQSAVGFAYAGNGSGLTLERAELVGQNLVLSVEHFSGAGATSMTPEQFERIMARLSALPMSLQVVAELFSALRAISFDERCNRSLTCQELVVEANDFLTFEFDINSCEQLAADAAEVAPVVTTMNLLLSLEGALQWLGANTLYGNVTANATTLQLCRERLTKAIVDLTRDGAVSDPLGVSGACATVVGIDYDRDGRVREVECILYVGLIASLQGITDQQARAIRAAQSGLRKVVDEAKPKCDQSFSHEEGLRELRKAAAMDSRFALLTSEIVSGLEYCVKITVTPPDPTVEVGEELDFTATAKDPSDISFAWSADRGTIDGAGLLTSPDTPGPLTVTAMSDQHHERTGTTRVTVACPAGQVEFQGQCRTISVSISPTTQTLDPGGIQQFTATVSNTNDTRVTWHASGGSITQSGLYTAPQSSGQYTVTAVSRADPSKSAQATVNVDGPEVVLAGSPDGSATGGAEIGAVADAGDGSYGGSCADSGRDEFQAEAPLNGVWSPSFSASASASSGSSGPEFPPCPAGSASANASIDTNNGWSVTNGRLSATFDVDGSASTTASGNGSSWAYASIGGGLWFEVVGEGTLTLNCSGDIPPVHEPPGRFGGGSVIVSGYGFDTSVFESADHDDPSFSIQLSSSEKPGEPSAEERYSLSYGYSEDARNGQSRSTGLSVTCSA